MSTHPLRFWFSCSTGLALLPSAGCSSGICTADSRPSVTVYVVDGTKTAISDATVTYSVDGGPQKDCWPFDEGSKAYLCGEEEAGHIVVTATRGASTQTAEVDVVADECHVTTVSATITLP
ncbi:Hypothetical protein A7982_10487 [Minicystis rosea]|nr:Hypothetical protein A7982_10487 [Minicystis rosea]